MQILRAYRSGVDLLTNADLADRTAFPRPTVSRLTRSLVEQGFLDYDIPSKGYRLSPVVLSLAYVFRQAENTEETVYPIMRALAESEGVNVGLALPNQLEMVYVESLRESRRGVFRRAASGSRFPMESTSGGRAYLAALGCGQRDAILKRIQEKHGNEWADIRREIEKSVAKVARDGYCFAHWQPGMTAVGTPLVRQDGRIYSVSISFHTPESLADAIHKYGQLLLGLKRDIEDIWKG
jgi:DNA-binding IclR family transcriptional regulator